MLPEISLLQGLVWSRYRGTPYKLNLNLTNLCNSRCRTCNIWTAYKVEPARAQEELREDEIKRLLRSTGLDLKWLTLAGGEPFLRPDFENILKWVIDECPSLSLLSIPSNGLDTDHIISCLRSVKDQKRLLIYLTFSLDGPPEVHDSVRGISGGYEKTWGTYMAARELLAENNHFRIALETTVSKYNIDCVEPFVTRLIDEGHSVIITIAHNAYQYKNERQTTLLPENSGRAHAVFMNLAELMCGPSPEQILKRIYLRNCSRYMGDHKKMIVPCTALQNSIVVDPRGDVFPCTMWNKKIGNIRDYDYDLMRIWNVVGRAEIRSEIERGQCPVCWTPCEAYQSILENFYRPAVFRNL